MTDVSTTRQRATFIVYASLIIAACSADGMTAKPSAKTQTQTMMEQATESGPATRAKDAGMVTRGAGMPIVPIHRDDAGKAPQLDAATSLMPATKPPVVVATTDAGHDAGQRDSGVDAGRVLDAGDAEAELPEPLHRYTFSGEGNVVHDEHGGPDAVLHGNAQLDGQGAVRFPGQGDGVVKLPDGFMGELTSFTLLVWLEVHSQTCGQRALELLHVREAAGQPGDPAMPELVSMFLSPAGCPDARPTLGYTDATSRYQLTSQTAITQSEQVQLGVSFIGRSRTLRLIVNGVVQRELSVPVDWRAVQRAQLWLGRSHFEAEPQLNGSITELRVYDSALEGNVLAQMFERDSP